MTTYTNAFGNLAVPPSEFGYQALTLTTPTTFAWPYNSGNGTTTISKIMDITVTGTGAMTLPDATLVSVGEDFLIRNVGSSVVTVYDNGGNTLTTVAAGAASYIYLTSNATAAGIYGKIAYGVGTSSVDAASLVGYGIKAIGASLNQSHPVYTVGATTTIDATYRSKLVAFNGGAATLNLAQASTLGNDYFVMVRNAGTGSLTIDPYASETIDGQLTLILQPGESLMAVCGGGSWYSVGYGRSTLYQFTQLTKDVSAAGTITLTSAEAANKLLTFTGNPASAVTVVVPAVVGVYYTYSNISTAQTITIKTAAGTGTSISQSSRVIVICDGTNVYPTQASLSNSIVSLPDGSSPVPSLLFASQTNTGLYKDGTTGVGVTANGTKVAAFDTTGLTVVLPFVATGTTSVPTAAAGNSSTTIANTAFAMNMQSPAFTGVPTAPTAPIGTATTQIATTSFVASTAFSAILPGQVGNAGKYLTTDGANASWGTIKNPVGATIYTALTQGAL